ASVGDAPLAAAGVPVSALQGTPAVNVLVATFTDAGGPEPVGNYTASIDWGDGSAATPGTVSAAGTTFNVFGSHTYNVPSRFVVTVALRDEGGSTATATTSALVAPIPEAGPGPNERFVSQAYLDLLRRPVDA